MLPIKQKKDWAKLLFLKEQLTQKEIASKVDVSEKTISKWVRDENWQQLRASITITKEESLRRFYMQVNEINDMISSREPGKRFPDSKETDTLVKLTATIKNLETDASVADVIEVFKRFLNFIRPISLEKAQEFIVFQDAFVKSILK